MKEQFEEELSSKTKEAYQKGLKQGQTQGGGAQTGREDIASEVSNATLFMICLVRIAFLLLLFFNNNNMKMTLFPGKEDHE